MPVNLNTPGVRLAIYARVSSEEQREGQTIDSQIAELERFARDKGWIIAGTYKDEGFSGAVMARPELDQLRDDATKGIFDAVLINDVDRLARDVAHLGVIKRDLEKKDVAVVFRKLPTETSPTYNLMVNILGSFAEFERELIADRTRRGRKHKVEVRQQFLGCLPPYGFRYIPKDRAKGTEGRLELNPGEATIARQMFSWVADEGLSARKVLRRLNELKILPRKGHSSWAKSSILRILHSEVYTGVWHYNKYQGFEPTQGSAQTKYHRHVKTALRMRPKKEWIALRLPEDLRLIPLKQWQRVQEQLSQNIAFSPRNGKHLYLLKGLVRCGGCSSQYVGEPCHNRFYYRCSKRCKRMPSIKQGTLDETIWQAVEQAMLKPDVIADGMAKQQAARAAKAASASSEREQIEQVLNQIEAEESRLLDAYRLSIITPVQLGQELEKTKNRKAALEKRQAELDGPHKEPPASDLRRSIQDYCRQAASAMAGFDDQQRQRFLRLLHVECTFAGNSVRIKGRLPVSNAGTDSKRIAPDPEDSPSGRIAGTEIDSHARNPPDEIPFEATSVIHTRTSQPHRPNKRFGSVNLSP